MPGPGQKPRQPSAGWPRDHNEKQEPSFELSPPQPDRNPFFQTEPAERTLAIRIGRVRHADALVPPLRIYIDVSLSTTGIRKNMFAIRDGDDDRR
jgi:hypothetical protein